jgi:iron(III) transport system permease protein
MNPPRFYALVTVTLFGLISILPICYVFSAIFSPVAGDSVGTPALFESRHLRLAFNSISLAAGAALSSVLIGSIYALLIARTDLIGSKIFSFLAILPILIPPYIHGIVWAGLDPFISRVFSAEIHSVGGGIFVLTLAYFPFVVLTTLAGLKSIDTNQEEAALLFTGALATFKRVTLPLSMPHIFTGTVFVFIFSVIDVGVPDILRVKVYPLEIFIQFSAFYDERAAALLSIPLICLTLFMVLMQRWHMRGRQLVQVGAGRKPGLQFRLGMLQPAGLAYCTLLLTLSVGLPLVVLMVKAGGIETYIRVLSTSIGEIGYSLAVAFIGALLAIGLGAALAYLMERWKGWKALAIMLIAVIPFAVPATSLGIGMIGVWNRPVLDVVYGSSFILAIAYAARFCPYASLVAAAGISHLSFRMEEAAALTGCRWPSIIGKIVFPLAKRDLAAGFFIVFVLAFGELGTSLLVMPPGSETIPIKIYNLMHYGAENLVAALCVILMLLIAIISGGLLMIIRTMRSGSNP